MTVTRVPASNPEPEVPTHWIAGESSMTWNNPVIAIACGAEGDGAYTLDKVTCAECLNVVMRRRCLALEDAPGPLRQRCTRPPHDDDRHSWRWDSAMVKALPELDTPSERLPVRTPGAALRVVQVAGDLWNHVCRAVPDGPTRDADLRELVSHIHAIQHAIMANAAARAHPELYRTLGGTLWNEEGKR